MRTALRRLVPPLCLLAMVCAAGNAVARPQGAAPPTNAKAAALRDYELTVVQGDRAFAAADYAEAVAVYQRAERVASQNKLKVDSATLAEKLARARKARDEQRQAEDAAGAGSRAAGRPTPAPSAKPGSEPERRPGDPQPASSSGAGPPVAPGRSAPSLSKMSAIVVPSEADARRFDRLADIAALLEDPKSDRVALVTEAARLCGFAIWGEDRSRLAEPTGAPAINLAVTNAEIRDYVEMYGAHHAVGLEDFIAGMDVLYRRVGGVDSTGQHIKEFLDLGPISSNMSARALALFLQDLGVSHQRAPVDHAGSWLDPIQALFLLRVVTEEMGTPARRALAKWKARDPGVDAGVDAGQPSEGRGDGGPVGSVGGPDPARPTVTRQPQAQEAPGWAEDAFAGGITGLFGAVVDLLDLGDTPFGKYSEGVGAVNTASSFVQFAATYVTLKGVVTVETPGEPLVRTLDEIAGEKRTIAAHFFIDGARVTDWMKDHRAQLVTWGLDFDMPKSGDLAGVETAWDVGQSRKFDTRQLIQTVSGTPDISKIRTDPQGVARVTFEGKPQPVILDPKKVKPLDKLILISVIPQVKTTEMKQDLVDAVTAAIGLKDGGLGILTPIMETLYRMKWSVPAILWLHVRDWQQAETIGQLTVEVHGRGTRFSMNSSTQMTVERQLTFTDTAMTVFGGEMPDPIDPKAAATMPPEALKALEAYKAERLKAAQQRRFISGGPGSFELTVNDVLGEFYIDGGDCVERSHPVHATTTWTGAKRVDLQPKAQEFRAMQFTVVVNTAEKTATLSMNGFTPGEIVYTRVPDPDGMSRKSPNTFDVFSFLKMQAPFDEKTASVVIPLKETTPPGESVSNYYGVVSVPFKFGPGFRFSGKATVSYSVTRKLVKPARDPL